MHTSIKWHSYALLALLYIVCALTFIISKYSLLSIDPLHYLFMRACIASLFFIIFAYPHRSYLKDIAKRIFDNKFLFLIVLFSGFIFAPLLDLWSLQYITGSQSALIFGLSPLVSSFCAYSFAKEKLSLFSILGILFAFFGVAINGIADTSSLSEVIPPLLPGLICFASVFFFSFSWIKMDELISRLQKNIKVAIPFPVIIGSCYIISAAILGCICKFYSASISFNYDSAALFLSFLTVLLSNVIFYWLYVYLMRIFAAQTVSIAGVFCPLYVIVLSYFILNQNLFSFKLIAGVIISALGVALYAYSRKINKI